jgi:hypothetical protein
MHVTTGEEGTRVDVLASQAAMVGDVDLAAELERAQARVDLAG